MATTVGNLRVTLGLDSSAYTAGLVAARTQGDAAEKALNDQTGRIAATTTQQSNVVSQAFSNMASSIGSAASWVASGVANIASTVWSAMQNAASAVASFTGSVASAIGGGLSSALSAVGSFAGSLWSTISGGLGNALSAVGSFASGLASTMGSGIQTALGYMGGFGQAVLGMASSVGSAISSVGGFFSNMAGSIGSAIGGVASSVWSVATGVGQAFADMGLRIGSAVSSAGSWFGNLVSGAGNMLSGVVGHVGGIGSAFGSMASTVGGWLGSAWEAVSGFAGRIGGALSGPISTLTSSFASFGATAAGPVAIGLGAAGVAMGGLGVMAIKQAANMETAELSMTTMLGSADRARDMLEQLRKVPLAVDYDVLVKNAQSFLAYGTSAQDVIPMITAVADASAAFGGSAETIDRMTRAFGQMQAKGKIQAAEMLQLTELGVPAWQMLANTLGVDVAQAQDMVTRGQVSAQQAIPGFVAEINKSYGGLADKQRETFTGMLGHLKFEVTQTLGAIGQALISGLNLKPMMDALASAMGPIREFAQGRISFGAMFEGLTGGATKAAELDQALQRLKGALDFVGQGFNAAKGALQPLTDAFGWLVANTVGKNLDAVFVAIGAAILAVVVPAAYALVGSLYAAAVGFVVLNASSLGIIAAIALVAAGVYLLIKHWDDIVKFMQPVLDIFKAIGSFLSTVFKPVFDVIGAAIGFVVEHWKAFAVALGILFLPLGLLVVAIVNLVKHFDTIKGAVATAASWIGDKLGAAFGWVAEKMAPVVGFLADKLGPVFQWIADNILPAFVAAIRQQIGFVVKIFEGIGWVIHKIADFFQWLYDVLIGGSIIPDLVNGILNWMGPGLKDKLIDMYWALKGVLDGIWNAIAGAAGAAWSWIVGVIGGAAQGVWGVISGVFGGIAAFIQGIWDAVGNAVSGAWSWISSVVSGGVQLVWNVITNVFGALVGWISSALSAIGSTFASAWNWIWSTVSGVVSGIFSTITSIFSAIWSWLGSVLSGIGNTFYSAWSWIWSTVTSIATGIWTTISSIFTTVWTWLTSVMSAISSMFWSAWSWIWSTVSNILTGLWTTIVTIFTTIWGWLSWLLNTIAQFFQSIWTWIRDNVIARVQEMWQWVTDRFWAFVNWAMTFLSDHANWLNNIWSWIRDSVTTRVSEMWQNVTGWVQNLRDSVQNIMYGLRDTVVSIWDQIVQWVKDRLNWVIGGINGFIGLLNAGLKEFGIPAIPTLGYLARGGVVGGGAVKGGVVDRPIYMLGEENRPETVIPWNPAYRKRAADLWNVTGEKLGLFETCSSCGPARDGASSRSSTFDIRQWLKRELGTDVLKNMGGPGGAQGEWWSGNFPMVQGPGGGFSHANLAPSWDYAMPNGTPIKMGLPGVVVNGPGGGYGTSLGINLDAGGSIVLGHLQSIVKTGRADVGELIAYSDNTGFSTGPHMHFEVRNSSISPGPGGEGGGGDLMGKILAWVAEILGKFEPNQGDAMAWSVTPGGPQTQPFSLFGSNDDSRKPGMLRGVLEGAINIPKAIGEFLIKKFSSIFKKLTGSAIESGTGGTITQDELFRLMDQVGFNAPRDWAARVVKCESGFNCGIIGPAWNGDGGSIGLWQIQPGAHPSADREKLKDCGYNTSWAKKLYDERGPAPWSCKAMGGILGLPQFRYYDRGGMMVGPGPIPFNDTSRPEMVLNERTYSRLISALERLEQQSGGRPEQHVTFNQEFNDVGTTAQEVMSDVLTALRNT